MLFQNLTDCFLAGLILVLFVLVASIKIKQREDDLFHRTIRRLQRERIKKIEEQLACLTPENTSLNTEVQSDSSTVLSSE